MEGAKYARDSLVLTKSKGQYWAGRVTAFLCRDPPGREDCHPDEQANNAEVPWFARAVEGPGISDGMARDLKCPVFRRKFKDDPTGNLWPLEKLSPCELLSVPHPSNLVVLSRFASFLQQIPEVL